MHMIGWKKMVHKDAVPKPYKKLLDDLITLHGIDTHHYLHPCTKILRSETLHQLLIMLRAHMTMSVLLFNMLAMC